MNSFTSKPVLPEYKSLGDELRLARERRSESLEAAAQALKIKPEYIVAIESEDWQSLPVGLYGKIFLKRYVAYLGLDYRILFKGRSQKKLHNDFDKSVFFNKVVKKDELRVWPRRWRNLAVVIVIGICFLYLVFYLKNIFSPPELYISTPNERVVDDWMVMVSGKADPETEVTVNNEITLLDKEGFFSRKVNLGPGVNTITIKAKKKYSRERIITKQVLVNR
jgi:cytoskeletal protein RodZ